MHKIIVTGPESSGKTTLCKALSKHFEFSFSKEYARKYLDTLNRDYNQNDLLKIAKGQLQAENGMQLLDTDLITIKIWSKYKYGSCDKWILNQIEKQRSEKRFYLLCKPDIPWEADPQRENPNDREELFEIYKKELENLSHNYYIVAGENRTINAISKLSSLKPII
jgi:nicotinamide riboside kinase|tara:strand:+ start:554 stop:1051 length:498 start_codon:yes stop_codon:yes gene_type:complete